MTDPNALIDRIYEAAFVPDLWPDVLVEIGEISGTLGGGILSEDRLAPGPPNWRVAALARDAVAQHIAAGGWRTCERPAVLLDGSHCGVLVEEDHLTPQQIERDSMHHVLAPLGVGWLTGTIIPMPTGEMVSFVFLRWLESGAPGAASIAILDGLRPHLARAGLIAARLRLERARSAVAGLDAFGLPAAVLDEGGRVLVANSWFEKRHTTFLSRAHGRIALADTPANALFENALSELRQRNAAGVRSIPVSAREGRPPSIVHVLPLVREAHVTFSGADILVVATTLGAGTTVPSPRLLHALFDLSPAEARLSAALATGQSLKRTAETMGITFKTARSYLEDVFGKTGTHRQSQLVALLKTVPQVDQDA